MSAGKSIRLFLADGTPGGLSTAEIMNWTGHVVAAPRSELAALLRRPEVGRTGVYILTGDDPAGGGTASYIGESDDIARRLYQHARPGDRDGKDFWDRAIVVTSKDANLTKAHGRYLESRLIQIAAQAGRSTSMNSTSPPRIALPEADVSDMEHFIEQAVIVLPVLGVNIFRSPAAVVSAAAEDVASPVFELRLRKEGVVATAREVDGEFTVLAGSAARRTWVGAEHHGYANLRAELEADGTLTPSDDDAVMRFTRSRVFNSPSAAASVASGRPANGRVTWTTDDGRVTFGAWQERGADAAFTPDRR